MAICKKIFGDDYYEEIFKKNTKHIKEFEDIVPYLVACSAIKQNR